MGHMVLQLIAVTPEAQMFFSAPQMIVRAAPDPVIIRMCSRARITLATISSALVNGSIPPLSFSIQDQTLGLRFKRGTRFLRVG